MSHFESLTLEENRRFLEALGEAGFDLELIHAVIGRPDLATIAVKAIRRKQSGEVRQRRGDVSWGPGDYVALDNGMTRIVAADSSERRAKEKAIVAGVSSPLILPASRLRG